MALRRLRPLLLGRSRERAAAWVAVAVVLGVLSLVDGHYEGVSSVEVHGFWFVRLLWLLGGICLAVAQAARNRSLLLSWLLVGAPVFGEALALGSGKPRYPPPSTAEVIQTALVVAALVAVVVGTVAYALGRAGARFGTSGWTAS